MSGVLNMLMAQMSAGGGVPTGNAFTFVDAASIAAATITVAAGNIGDVVVVAQKWEDAGTITGITAGNGETVTLGTVANNSGSNGEPHVVFGWYISNSTGANNIAFTNSGSVTFRASWAFRFTKAGGTVSIDTQASGSGASGNASTGSFTTGTVNGVTLAFNAGYTGGVTYSSNLIGGNTGLSPTTQDSSVVFYYINSAQLSSVTANTNPSPSATRWTMASFSLKAV